MNTNKPDEIKTEVAAFSDDAGASKPAKKAVRRPRAALRASTNSDAAEQVAVPEQIAVAQSQVPVADVDARSPRLVE